MNPFAKPKPATQVAAPAPIVQPTIDTAAQTEEYSRQLRRRKGHMANLIAGASAQPASVAARALLGGA